MNSSVYCYCRQFQDVLYEGSQSSEDELKDWLSEKCVPLVREITFENGEVCVCVCACTCTI